MPTVNYQTLSLTLAYGIDHKHNNCTFVGKVVTDLNCCIIWFIVQGVIGAYKNIMIWVYQNTTMLIYNRRLRCKHIILYYYSLQLSTIHKWASRECREWRGEGEGGGGRRYLSQKKWSFASVKLTKYSGHIYACQWDSCPKSSCDCLYTVKGLGIDV